jgi:hypothetical protein
MTPMALCVDVTQIKEEEDPKDLLSPAFVRVSRQATRISSRSAATSPPTRICPNGSGAICL